MAIGPMPDCSFTHPEGPREAWRLAGAQTAEGTRHKQPVMQELMRKLTTELEADSRPGHVREIPPR